jgi:hypothetical protein
MDYAFIFRRECRRIACLFCGASDMSKQAMAQSLFILTAIIIVIALIAINELRHMPLPAMYFTCSRDQVDANLHNQPKGFEPAMVNHCVLHSGSI